MRPHVYRPVSIVLLLALAGFITYRSVVTGVQLHRVIQYSPQSGLVGYAHMLSLLFYVALLGIILLSITALYKYQRRSNERRRGVQ